MTRDEIKGALALGSFPRVDLVVGASDDQASFLEEPPPAPELNAELQSIGRTFAAWS